VLVRASYQQQPTSFNPMLQQQQPSMGGSQFSRSPPQVGDPRGAGQPLQQQQQQQQQGGGAALASADSGGGGALKAKEAPKTVQVRFWLKFHVDYGQTIRIIGGHEATGARACGAVIVRVRALPADCA
jgi:hypothetical protein